MTEPDVVALVVLRPASGRSPAPDASITSATIAEHLPDAEAVSTAQAVLGELGFAVGPAVGTSLSISADRSRFEEVFGVPLEQDRSGGWTVRGRAAAAARELPLDPLPRELGAVTLAVVFEEPEELHEATDP